MEQQNLTLHLTEIPVELVIMIFKDLPDLESLFSIIRTCRRLYQCFKNNDLCIITSIVSNIHQRAIQLDLQANPFPNRGSCLMIQQLIFAIKKKCIRREIVLQMFKNAWAFLVGKGLEELLIPVGIELARTVGLNDHRQNAIEFLQQIALGQPPFRLSAVRTFKGVRHQREEYGRLPPPTFSPLESILFDIHQSTETKFSEKIASRVKKYIRRRQRNLRRLPIALITDGGMRFFQSPVRLRDGIYHGPNFTLIRLSNPQHLWKIHSRWELEDVTRTQSGLCHLPKALED